MKLKKRNILSVLITVVILFALNKLWLEFKPMEVVINASGSSSGSIEVQLNKKADNKFKKINPMQRK